MPPTADCHPITVVPGLHRFYLDYCAGKPAADAFLGSALRDESWMIRPGLPPHWPDLIAVLAEQNPGAHSAASIQALSNGAGLVVTGQQVGLFGGPLFTPFKAATALARARRATAEGKPHVAVFWLASEDHDFAEISHVTFPSRRELRTLEYKVAPPAAVPVGGVAIGDEIKELVEQAGEAIGASEALDALTEAWQPGKTLAQAFAEFYRRIFAPLGLLVLDASGRQIHRMGAPVLRAGIERADELHAGLAERDRQLQSAGYESQVAVMAESSLLFLIDDQTGARTALKRLAPSAGEPAGAWQAGRELISTADLLGILDSEPERISPSALLRPVFQDYLLSTSLTIGGPAEIAYFAQAAVNFQKVLGRQTPIQPRFSATLIEPAVGELLRKHELSLDRVFAETEASLGKLLAARAMPVEGKQRIAAVGNAVDVELNALVDWMKHLDTGLGQSGETAANKIRYQVNRMREMTANFELQKEASLGRHAQAIGNALYPDGVLQERLHGAAYYFGRYGFGLAEDLVKLAENPCPGHMEVWL